MTDGTLAHDETQSLIASNKVEGTAVFDRAGEKLGTIHNFMVDKRSGQADYAVLTFGGLFGLGNDYYPIPWDMLTYEQDRGGYVVNIDKNMLDDAPRFEAGNEPAYDRAFAEQIHEHYSTGHTTAD